MNSRIKKAIHLALLCLTVLLLCGAGTALADKVMIVTLSEDHLESAVDASGTKATEVIEAYTRMLEAAGHEVTVAGSNRSDAKKTMIIYTTGNQAAGFDWTVGDTGKNDRYYERSLSTIAGQDYDRMVLIFGKLSTTPRKATVDFNKGGTIPVTIFCLDADNDAGKVMTNLARATGQTLTQSGLTDTNGYTPYGTLRVKGETPFSGTALLKDLFGLVYEQRLEQNTAGELTIPATSLENGVLVMTGSDLSGARLLVDGEKFCDLTENAAEADESHWLAQSVKVGGSTVCLIRLPQGMTGKLSAFGAEATLTLYYEWIADYETLLANEKLCPDGLQFADNGALQLKLSSAPIVRELFDLYPDCSFQALVSPMDSGKEPYTVYADDQGVITLQDTEGVNAEIVVRVMTARENGTELCRQTMTYRSIKKFLDELEFTAVVNGAMEKGGEASFRVSVKGYPESAESREQVEQFLRSARVVLQDGSGNTLATFTCGNGTTLSYSCTTTLPVRSGTYHWKVLVQSPEDFSFAWSRECSVPEFAIANADPVTNTVGLTLNSTASMQPGETWTFTVPEGLFSDPDGDVLTIHYTEKLDGSLIQEGEWTGEQGTSPACTLQNLDQFGTWTVEVCAEDTEGRATLPITFTIRIEDANTVPVLNTEAYAQLKPLQGASVPSIGAQYTIGIPADLFTDNEGDAVTLMMTRRYGQEEAGEAENITGKQVQLDRFGDWELVLWAVDEHGLESERVTLRFTLVDALESLTATLSSEPAEPGKREEIRLVLTLSWPEEYESLDLMGWLKQRQALCVDAEGTTWAMTLDEQALRYVSDALTMPDTSATLTYTAALYLGEEQCAVPAAAGLTVEIANAAPAQTDFTAESKSAFVFELADCPVTAANSLFADADNDPLSFSVRFVNDQGEATEGPQWSAEEAEQQVLTVPGFGTWEIQMKAADNEGQDTGWITCGKVTVHNLKLILLIAAAVVAVIIAVIVVILVIRHKRNKPRFHSTDFIVFRLKGQDVSEHIRMKDQDDTDAIPLAAFAGAIHILLSDEQWSNLREWALCPTHGEHPALRKLGAKDGKDTSVDLGGGLKVIVNDAA